jgi:cytochrome c peroxidase
MRPQLPLLLLCGLIAAGCQPASRYGAATRPRSTRPVSPSPPATQGAETPPDIVWMEPKKTDMSPVVPIVFIDEVGNREAWQQLQQFWTEDKPTPAEAAALLALWPPGVGLLPPERLIRIKVPLGLKSPPIPAANPPTRGKWELGKQLFFDQEAFLQPANATQTHSCATCHMPAHGYTDGRAWPTGSERHTPTLINSAYNHHQFWDGRAAALEEVVQRPAKADDSIKQHNWTGVVERLRGQPEYVRRFQQVFGTPPTQDAVGKALATYLRTVLVGNSLYDRAAAGMRQRGGHALTAVDFEKVLDEATIKSLLAPDAPLTKPEAARALHRGYTLFTGRDQAGCVRCHDGPTFTDHGFHNLGIGDSSAVVAPGRETGRFAVVPPGLKDRQQIGAYKTPMLRALPRTGPYFHDGSRQDLFDVVAWHVSKAPPGPFLDPEIRNRELPEADVRALVLFLKALDGDPVADIVSKR